jgi:hypothetical protein
VAEQLPAVAKASAAGGFAHPYSRSVALAPVARSTLHEHEPREDKKEQPMHSRSMDAVAGGAGFFHPFARSVGQPTMPPPRLKAALPPRRVDIPAVRTEKSPATGGFVNPYAINPQMRPDRL